MCESFIGHDKVEPYREALARACFVYNNYPGQSKVHKATCKFIQPDKSGILNYEKIVCANDAECLRSTLESRGLPPVLCGSCSPQSFALAVVSPAAEQSLLVSETQGSFTDALRGYAYPIHRRDGFRCVYCGRDGSSSFDDWLTKTWDHLLPKGHPQRDDPEYIVTACHFCNVADNRYFDKASQRGISFDGKTRDDLVALRKKYVFETRDAYRRFWEQRVRKK
jgi:hypothetical protein